MAAVYLVIYDGAPENPQEFLRFYAEEHVPIMWTLPGIRGIEIEVGAPAEDPLAQDAGIFMIARFRFDSLADLQAALSSPARRLARADMGKFPKFRGQIRHQAVEIREIRHGGG